MSLNRGEVNPLNVLGLRKLSFIPTHFSKVSIEYNTNIKDIESWINYNLNSRYGIINNFSLDENKKINRIVEIGFEDPKELIMLTLGCVHLHKNKKEN